MERTDQFIGQSYAFLDAVERASRAAPLNRPVLVIGERGTGKELIAERLHHLSSRWAGPLIVMNCAALPENLIEAELFGHEAGSFTGAAKTRHGRFEEADGGTLFLDELGSLSMPAQDRLLRAVEYGEITRIGASKPISVDVRIVAATNENLPSQVDKGKFRAGSARSPVVRSRSLCRRSAHARATFRCSPSISADGCRPSSSGPTGPASRRGRAASSKPITGRAMCASCGTWSNARSTGMKIPSGAIDEIQFDPFHSPWAPTASTARLRRLKPTRARAEPSAASPGRARQRRTRPMTFALRSRLMSARCSRMRCAATATTSGRPRPRLGLSYDQLRHALKRHKLQDSAADVSR